MHQRGIVGKLESPDKTDLGKTSRLHPILASGGTDRAHAVGRISGASFSIRKGNPIMVWKRMG